jgi:putative acetyltransferase
MRRQSRWRVVVSRFENRTRSSCSCPVGWPRMNSLTVRQMHPDEFGAVRALSIDAFGGDESIGTLIDALRASWAWHDELSFVAEFEGKLVGHVLYTRAILDAPERLIDVLVLSPVGVTPSTQRIGIGTQLVTKSMQWITMHTEYPLVFLEGHPAYYPRFGFQAAHTSGFRKPSLRTPDDAFMVAALRPSAEILSGTLVYPDAFWRTDSVGLR